MTINTPHMDKPRKRATFGKMRDGGTLTIFKGSSWTVMDLRCTFAGLPEYKLEKRLRGLHDITSWIPGWLQGAPDVR